MFDLERAINGEAVCLTYGGDVVELAWLPSAGGAHKLYGVSMNSKIVMSWTEEG